MPTLTAELVRERVRGTILERIGDTPLLRLRRIDAGLKGELWAKLESANPGGSVKDRPGLWMVLAAELDDRMRRESILIDATSGNTGVALALACAVRGHRLTLVMPACRSSASGSRAPSAPSLSSPTRSRAPTAPSAKRRGLRRATRDTSTSTSTRIR
jgi:threonine dehydratase